MRFSWTVAEPDRGSKHFQDPGPESSVRIFRYLQKLIRPPNCLSPRETLRNA